MSSFKDVIKTYVPEIGWESWTGLRISCGLFCTR